MPKDLRTFLDDIKKQMPEALVEINRQTSPYFEVTAVQRKLEKEGRFPILLFNNMKNQKGNTNGFRLVTNAFAEREYCAVALGLDKSQWRMETSFEFAKRSQQRIKYQVIKKEEAPVKQVIKTGDDIDLYDLPILTHHEMDGFPYLVDAVVAADPDTGIHNSSHHRMRVRCKNELGIWMSPRHLWDYARRAEERGEPLPLAMVHGHHPGFFLASESIAAIDSDEYEIAGAVLGEPLRVVPSEAFGDKLMIPADAEVVVEGEILPGVRDAEGPFGEFTGYYGPQRWSPVIRVKAITYRKDPIYLNILCGAADTSILGGIPKEAGIYEEIKRAVPNVKAVHFPISGTCRFHAYVSIDKKVDGEGMVAAMAAFPHHDELKHVWVVDADIDVFNEREVLWAMSTRVQPWENVHTIRDVRGGTLDPSATKHAVGSKMIIDCTKPISRPFAEKIKVPDEEMAKINLDEWLTK